MVFLEAFSFKDVKVLLKYSNFLRSTQNINPKAAAVLLWDREKKVKLYRFLQGSAPAHLKVIQIRVVLKLLLDSFTLTIHMT